jgi:lipopolysaccharide transport system ATP-binding protein
MDKIMEVTEISKTYKKEKATIPALQQVSFELSRGDVLGIIGRNGAGKTTLLKILAGIVQPTTGKAVYKGRLVSILEFGTGFHPDLTGKENVFLNARLLGMRDADIRDRFKAIVEFSELEESILQPVKYYSNGMYLRLAFSIFTHLYTDILLLDEVISVGDFSFRQKCHERIGQLAAEGTTILMVSHFPNEVRHLCNKYLWLESGGMAAFGGTPDILEAYLEKNAKSANGREEGSGLSVTRHCLSWPEGYIVKNEVRLFRYGIRAVGKNWDEQILLTDTLEIEMEFEKLKDGHTVEMIISIRSLYEAWVLVDSYGIYTRLEREVIEKGRYSCTCRVPAGMINFGTYQLGLLVSRSKELIYQNPYLLNFNIQFQELEGRNNQLAREVKSIIRPTGDWEIRRI